ncbi:MAG: carbon-nitrogen hydrolase family protein, partial [Actinomycetota bacterium]|nr:carbon-nitrogen hydrolase family protein [Actinomycetota bacterium]
AFMVAADQFGEAPPHYNSYGRSAIVDPWGVVLAMAPDEECFVSSELDLAAQERIRETLPALANRRPAAYQWPEHVGVG